MKEKHSVQLNEFLQTEYNHVTRIQIKIKSIVSTPEGSLCPLHSHLSPQRLPLFLVDLILLVLELSIN